MILPFQIARVVRTVMKLSAPIMEVGQLLTEDFGSLIRDAVSEQGPSTSDHRLFSGV